METYDDLIETIIESYQKAQAEIGQCNILIIGKTGVGKSTLINAVFREPLAETGEGYPVTQDIRQYRKKGFPLTVYDTPGLELDAKQLQRVTKDVAELIESKKRENVKEHVHVVWYCINHNANRLEEIEKEWLKSLDLEVPIILILTQTLTRKRSEFTAWLEGQNLPVRQIIPVLARPKEIDEEHIIKEYGLEQIVQTTFDLLPEVAQKAFINATKDINIKARRAFNYVTSYATAAAATGATPIPFSDAPILATEQVVMLTHITTIFGLPFDAGFIGTMISSIAGVGGASLLGRAIVSNLLKMIPGVGTIAGGVISGATASALTLALGLAYIEALKRYMKAKLQGKEMSSSDLSKILLEQYKYYVHSGRKTMQEEEEPKTIEISAEADDGVAEKDVK